MLFGEEENQGKVESSPILTSLFMDHTQINNNLPSQTVPKLEDFLGDSSSSSTMVRFSDCNNQTQTDTTQEDSSLTQILDHHHHHQQDLKALVAHGGFQAFSANNNNSGSELTDSASAARTQLEFAAAQAHSAESGGRSELAFSAASGPLSLAVSAPERRIVADRDCSKNNKQVSDTFGQRTSIYRGVTRYYTTLYDFLLLLSLLLLLGFG